MQRSGRVVFGRKGVRVVNLTSQCSNALVVAVHAHAAVVYFLEPPPRYLLAQWVVLFVAFAAFVALVVYLCYVEYARPYRDPDMFKRGVGLEIEVCVRYF